MPRQTWNHDQIGHGNGVLGAPMGHGANNDTGCRRCPVTTWNHDRIGHENGVLGAPKGHCIPVQGETLGTKDPMSRVLKERRISRDRRFAWGLCGVPSERTDFTSCSQGFTLGWYAMPRWGMGPTTTPDAADAPSQYGTDGDTHGGDVFLGHGTTIKSVVEMGFWVPQRGMGPMDNPLGK